MQVKAGRWIMRDGDVGRQRLHRGQRAVEVIDEGPPERLIRILRRGDVLGELALLRKRTARPRHGPTGLRTAGARPRGVRGADPADAPSFALGLTRAMGAQLAASRAPDRLRSRPRRRSPSSGSTPQRPRRTSRTCSSTRSAVTGRSRASPRRARDDRPGRADSRPGGPACAARTPTTTWSRRLRARGDLVIALTTRPADRTWLAHATCAARVRADRSRPGSRCETLAMLQPREVQVIAEGPGAARPGGDRAADRRALAGTGALRRRGRALAHLGALEELAAAGLRFDRVAGVSLGSLVGRGRGHGSHDRRAL